jgi:hypothetical protein
MKSYRKELSGSSKFAGMSSSKVDRGIIGTGILK